MPKKSNATVAPLAVKTYKKRNRFAIFAQGNSYFLSAYRKEAREGESPLAFFINLTIAIHHCKDALESDGLIRQLKLHIANNSNLSDLIACSTVSSCMKNHLFYYLEKYSQSEPNFFFNA